MGPRPSRPPTRSFWATPEDRQPDTCGECCNCRTETARAGQSRPPPPRNGLGQSRPPPPRNGYGKAATTFGATKGRLIRCTVPGSTPNRLAMTRTPGLPGVARASRIRFSSAGAPHPEQRPVQRRPRHRLRRFIGGRPGLRRHGKGGHPAACRSWWHRCCRCERHQPASRHRPAAAMLPLRQRTIHPQIDGRSVIVLLFSYAIRKLNNKGGGHGDHRV
jgi:hypothetical protein